MRRTFLCLGLCSALLAAPASARAAGLWLSTNGFTPGELRVAIAASPERTTVWTSLSFASWPTTLGLVLPVPSATMVDVSPDAWFDALDQATAPRVYASPNLLCPNGAPPDYSDPGCAAIAELTAPQSSIPAVSFDFLDSPGAVVEWANDHDMAVPYDVSGSLDALTGSRFVAVRFTADQGGVTETIRVVMPNAEPKLVLSLFDPSLSAYNAAFATTWLIGPGLGSLTGASPAFLDPTQLEPNDCYTNNYFGMLYDLLETPGSSLVQCAGREVWTTPASLDPSGQFDSVLDAYFQNAVPGGFGSPDPTTCLYAAADALASDEPVGEACPAAAEGVVDGGPACHPLPALAGSPASHVTDPAPLRCGGADDVAVAFSGLVPNDVWLTRQTLYLGAGNGDYPVTFGRGQDASPLVYADALDTGWCSGEGSGGSGGGGSASGSSSGCDGGDAAEGAAEGCGAAAEGLGDLGDIDCSASRARSRRPSAWTLVIGLAALLAPLRRRTRRSA